METKPRHYRPSVERLRIILMFFLCIYQFGFPTAYGEVVQTVCGFVPIAFFLLSGYLILRPSDDRPKRILRAVRRSGIAFAAFAAVCLVINFFSFKRFGLNMLYAFTSKRFWFNFLVMNVWQFEFGNMIWYVQALFYAYLIIFFLEKYKLLKYDWLIAAVLLLLTILTGEFSGILRWNIAGYTYIPGNFFTRALPYILLGGFIHRKMPFFRRIRRRLYLLGIVIGAVLSPVEILLFSLLNTPGYYGHLIGMGITAFSVCMLAFTDRSVNPGFEAALHTPRRYVNSIYYLCQPVYLAAVSFFSGFGKGTADGIRGYLGIFTFGICFGIAWYAAFLIRKRRKKSNGHSHSAPTDTEKDRKQSVGDSAG